MQALRPAAIAFSAPGGDSGCAFGTGNVASRVATVALPPPPAFPPVFPLSPGSPLAPCCPFVSVPSEPPPQAEPLPKTEPLPQAEPLPASLPTGQGLDPWPGQEHGLEPQWSWPGAGEEQGLQVEPLLRREPGNPDDA